MGTSIPCSRLSRNPKTTTATTTTTTATTTTIINNCATKLFIFYLMVSNLTYYVLAIKCVCNAQECDTIRPQDCPGKGFMVWDPCKCCKVCAKTIGEACGGPGGFSGTCEPPLQCISKPPVTGSGVCLDLPRSSTLNCQEMITLESGCEIINRKCRCWGRTHVCKDSHTRWDFSNLEECQLNLQNLVKTELEFDEDYTIPPKNFETTDCNEVVCPPMTNIVCPDDSHDIIFDPSAAHYLIHDVNENYDTKILEKRSVQQYNKRESIKIVPSGYINKRSIPDDEDFPAASASTIFTNETPAPESGDNPESSENELVRKCCPQKKCICNSCPRAPQKCLNETEVPILATKGTNQTGSCCNIYKCGILPNCTSMGNGYKWEEHCKTCQCIDKQHLCHNTCEYEVHPNNCYSRSLNKPFMNGELWMEDDCTECECIAGDLKCVASSCKPQNCKNPIKIPGECCPKCDLNETNFCPENQNCETFCRNGFQVSSETGCSLCQCAKTETKPDLEARGNESWPESTPEPVVIGVPSSTQSLSEEIIVGDVLSQPPSTASPPGTVTRNFTFPADIAPSTTFSTIDNYDKTQTHHATEVTKPSNTICFNTIFFFCVIGIVIVLGSGAFLAVYFCRKRPGKPSQSYTIVSTFDSNQNKC